MTHMIDREALREAVDEIGDSVANGTMPPRVREQLRALVSAARLLLSEPMAAVVEAAKGMAWGDPKDPNIITRTVMLFPDELAVLRAALALSRAPSQKEGEK